MSLPLPAPECSIYYPELDNNPGIIINPRRKSKQGFTLIELSIVLVIIGLIVGGVLVGRDLIGAASVRAQVTQIEKFHTATATFYGKYGYLPGDMPPAPASQYGFATRAGTTAQGDGNGELDGPNGSGTAYAYNESGENLMFWEDLSTARLIDGNFTAWVDNVTAMNCLSPTACAAYFPAAKIGGANLIYTYSGLAINCPGGGGCTSTTGIGPNFFGLSIINAVGGGNVNNGGIPPAPGLTVKQAYDIDKKIDDGIATSGKVLAQYLTAVSGHPGWSANATPDSSATCFNTTTNAYSVTINNGASVMCGLSFQFQTGD